MTLTRPAPLEPGYLIAPRPRFRADIQGLRAVAVLLVIADHARIPGMSGGYMGVDVFFVISGFVITQVLLDDSTKPVRTGLLDFYSRRVRRIVPAATATLVLTAVVAKLALGKMMDPNLPGDIRWASLFGANLRYIDTGAKYFVAGVNQSLITQFWSLGVEEQFYLCFPIVVFLVARWVDPHLRTHLLAMVLGAGVALSLWWSVHSSPGAPAVAYYSPLTRFWELGLGCLLATLMAFRPPTRNRVADYLAAAGGVSLLVAGVLVLRPSSIYPGWLAILPCGGAFLLIWAGGAGARNPVSWLLSTRPLRYVGDISYSLYLTHYAWLYLPLQLTHPLGSWGWRVVELAGTAITAIASYHLVENPIRRSKRLAGDRLSVALLLGVCVAAVWAVSFAIT